jgi:transcriptional regulator with XRE-family HTH domain
MKEVKSQEIKNVIKNLLKKNGVTYEEVATHLDCSLPTVNRILGTEEISLNRILELCDLLNVSFSDLGAMTKESHHSEEHFSDSQEHFLSKHDHFFAYFLKLMSGDTPKKIAENFHLTQKSTDKYLLALEKNELIRVTGKNKIRPVFKNMPRLGRGPLGRNYFDKIINGASRFFVENIRKNLNSKETQTIAKITVNGSKMTELTYRKFTDEVEALFSRYRDISDMEEKIKNSKELKTVVFNYGHTIVENDDPSLKILDNIFGEIKNI